MNIALSQGYNVSCFHLCWPVNAGFIFCFAKGRYRIIHGKKIVSQIDIFQGQLKEIYIVINFKMRTK